MSPEAGLGMQDPVHGALELSDTGTQSGGGGTLNRRSHSTGVRGPVVTNQNGV